MWIFCIRKFPVLTFGTRKWLGGRRMIKDLMSKGNKFKSFETNHKNKRTKTGQLSVKDKQKNQSLRSGQILKCCSDNFRSLGVKDGPEI